MKNVHLFLVVASTCVVGTADHRLPGTSQQGQVGTANDRKLEVPLLRKDGDLKITVGGSTIACPTSESEDDFAMRVHGYLRGLNPMIDWTTGNKNHKLNYDKVLYKFSISDPRNLGPGQQPRLYVNGVSPEEWGLQLYQR
jgi:hypothetical protein